jgi:hypothetical protein
VIPIRSDLLTASEQTIINRMLGEIEARRDRNVKLLNYYDGVARIRDLGIAIPPHLRNIETVVGWPAKSVDVREARLDIEDFVLPSGESNPLDVMGLWEDNEMPLESSQTHTSTLLHGLSFTSVTAGDTAAGEPEVLFATHEATNATVEWNSRTRRPNAALAVTGRNSSGEAAKVIAYFGDVVLTLTKLPMGWIIERIPHQLGRVPVVLMTRRPRVGRRFGMPVISRAVISLTDSAVRTLLRSEVSAEFFSVPQRYALGVNDDAFTGTGWEAIIGKFLAVSRDDEGDIPTMGQFPQVSMQGHSDQLKSLAMMFSGETSIPVSYLGIIQDNPSSADAIRVGETSLIEDIERDQTSFGYSWSEIIRLGVMVRDGLSEPPRELQRLRPRWRDASTPTRQAQTQNVVQLIQVGALPPVSQVTYEQLGYNQITIDRLLADQRRQKVSSLVAALPARAAAATADPAVAALAVTRGNGS